MKCRGGDTPCGSNEDTDPHRRSVDLGIMGITLLKPRTKPDDTEDQSSADITQPEEPETPEEEPVLLAVESQYELGFDAY